MRYLLASFILLLYTDIAAQVVLRGTVKKAENREPLAGASVILQKSAVAVQTDNTGGFAINLKTAHDTLVVTHVGYTPTRLAITNESVSPLVVLIHEEGNLLDEVEVSTGYYSVARERATGSFTQIGPDLIERSVSTDIISRLEGITNSLSFDRTRIVGESDGSPDLRVRGLSTINSNETPLIVVDNFPYEGDISNINPNDIAGITVLKDAAAASIWGARAGNGVIVITTKRGTFDRKPVLNLTNNTTIGQKPDLFYNRTFMPSAARIEIEKELFDRNHYVPQDWTVLPPYVERLFAHKNGLLTDAELAAETQAWNARDVRRQAREYLYRSSVNQQIALNLSGGSNSYSYYISGGYDRNWASIIGNDFRRLTFTSATDIKPIKNLSIHLGLAINGTENKQNGLGLSEIVPSNLVLPPYTLLADDTGNALAVPMRWRQTYVADAEANGLLDWHFRPLDEVRLADNKATNTEFRINLGADYKLMKGLNVNLKYQYQRFNGQSRNYFPVENYYVRDRVNQFTQPDGYRAIPAGNILEGGNNQQTAHYGRMQFTYQHDFDNKHQLVALAGAEIRQQLQTSLPGYRIYDYNDDVLTGITMLDYETFYTLRPQGRSRIPAPPSSLNWMMDRFVSYFANGSHTYDNRYTLSASARWDASNLFGVNTNQQGVPLWSIGGMWTVSNEQFYHVRDLPYLRLRLTYGHNGNVNRTISTLPIVTYGNDTRTGLPNAILRSTGNPDLRWEQVGTLNLGLDMASKNNRLQLSIEYYRKRASDLIGENFMDPTSGIIQVNNRYEIDNRINYANMDTKGIDVEISTINTKGAITWQSTVLFNMTRNTITNYRSNEAPLITDFFNPLAPPTVGTSRDVIYAIPWYGLDHKTGMPLVMTDGVLHMDYSTYMNNLKREDLLVIGTSVPPYFGSIRNTFGYKNITASFNILWKAGHHFRRPSINYGSVFNSGGGHIDYLDRWQKPGDEAFTNVPAKPNDVVLRRDQVYLYSDALIESGSHIRLQDINLSYRFSRSAWPSMPFRELRLYTYVNNIGILWRKNKYNIDPDMISSTYPQPRTIAFGMQVSF